MNGLNFGGIKRENEFEGDFVSKKVRRGKKLLYPISMQDRREGRKQWIRKCFHLILFPPLKKHVESHHKSK